MTGLPVVALAGAAALFLWWFSTGVLFWLARRAPGPGAVIAGSAGVLALSLWALDQVAWRTDVPDAFLSFVAGLGAWAVIEITFLTGVVTGPGQHACPPGLRGRQRFVAALGTILWHELAILAIGATMLALTWGAPNQVGTWAFVLLMAMRISAKLNLFLGVPYPPSTLLPPPLAHLDSYFRTGPFTLLLPVVVTTATALATLIAWHAADPAVDAFQAASHALFWTLLVLGIVEHWFLILPVREGALWAWFTGLPARGSPPAREIATAAGAPAAQAPPYVASADGGRA